MQLVLSGQRIIAHGENFITMGGVVINTETGAKYENATVAECDGCPSDIGEVGYEYHAGVFVPCAPYGKGDGNIMVACQEDCGAPKDSGLKAKNLLMQNYIPTSYLPHEGQWSKMATSGNMIVAIDTNSRFYAYSTDGINWTEKNLPSKMIPVSVVYGNNKFIVTYNDKAIAVSADGINWTAYDNAFSTAQKWDHLAYGNGVFVATSSESSVAAYSTDGINWTETEIPTWGYETVRGGCIAYGNGIFLIVGSNSGYSAKSTDGATWEIVQNKTADGAETKSVPADSLVFNGNKFIATYEENVYLSTDGKYWSTASLPDEFLVNNRYSLAYGINIYGYRTIVAVAQDSKKAAMSLNGTQWIETTLPKYQYWKDVIFSGDKFIAIAYNSKIAAYSYDGENWTCGKLEFMLPNGTDITEVVAETLVNYYGMAYQEGVENA